MFSQACINASFCSLNGLSFSVDGAIDTTGVFSSTTDCSTAGVTGISGVTFTCGALSKTGAIGVSSIVGVSGVLISPKDGMYQVQD